MIRKAPSVPQGQAETAVRFAPLRVVDNHRLLEIPRDHGNDRGRADVRPVVSGQRGVGRVKC